MAITGLLVLSCVCVSAVLAQSSQDSNNGAGYASSTSSSEGGFASKPLVFSTILFEPYTMESENRKAQGNDRFIGFIPDLVKELADRLDFDYELRLVKDNKWGARDSSTGKWNGMIGEVIRGEVDFAAAPITITDMRKSVVDFTNVVQDVSVTALVKADSGLSSLDDILRWDNLTYGTIRDGSTARGLMGSRDPQVNKLWSRIMSQNALVDSTWDGINRVRNGGYAFIMEKPIADYFVAQDCGLETTGNFLNMPGFAFPARKFYPDMDKVNQALAEIKRKGDVQTLLDKWWAPQACGAPRGITISSALILISALLSMLL